MARSDDRKKELIELNKLSNLMNSKIKDLVESPRTDSGETAWLIEAYFARFGVGLESHLPINSGSLPCMAGEHSFCVCVR